MPDQREWFCGGLRPSSCQESPMRRRQLLQQLGALAAGTPLAGSASGDLLVSVNREVLLHGRDGAGTNWFHPRPCRLPDGRIFMTLQPILGSDDFGPVHATTSGDLGRHWSPPQPVPPLGRVTVKDPLVEGVCDVVPEWHAASGSLLALGHNVFYTGPGFSKNQPPRWPVYAVWKDGAWGPRRKLEWDDPRGSEIYSNNCGQRVNLEDGRIAMAFTHGAQGQPRAVSGVISTFEDGILRVQEVGPALEHPHGRGLLEPSVARFDGRFFLTLRAEDGRGYVSTSPDGLRYAPHRPWTWDDGEALEMSTTQQHWLVHSEALFLVYTRRDASNTNVTRWRSPLWMAQVDPDTLRLLRATERVVLPLVGDGVNAPDGVALMGNFHVIQASPEESWVTVGEWHPRQLSRGGDVLLARLRWRRPNRAAAAGQ